jgi:HPt (histidine-containing phosphotransfer) domain-containing protein
VRDERQEEWLRLNGLNVIKGIGYFNGDKDTYFGVLRSFAASIPNSLRKIEEVGDLQEYAVIVHGIKGSSRGVCAEAIEIRAELLENAARTGDRGFVDAHNAEFLEAVRDLLSRIGELFARTDKFNSQTPAPGKAKPDGKTLLRLLAACEKYDTDAAEAAVAELSGYEYDSGAELADWIAEKMGAYDLEGIARRLSALPDAERQGG